MGSPGGVTRVLWSLYFNPFILAQDINENRGADFIKKLQSHLRENVYIYYFGIRFYLFSGVIRNGQKAIK